MVSNIIVEIVSRLEYYKLEKKYKLKLSAGYNNAGIFFLL